METRLLTSILSGVFLIICTTYFTTGFSTNAVLNSNKGLNAANERMQSPSSLSCKSNVQLSLGYEGYGVLEPQTLLADKFQDYSRFEVEIVNPPVGTDTADCSMVGTTIMVEVRDTVNGIKCWSNVLVEDKLPPQFSCDTVNVACNIDPYAANDSLYLPDLSDNCSDNEDLTITFNQTQSSPGCQSPYVLIINRTWYISDESGNSATCNQVIRLERPDMDSIVFPENDTLYCPNTNTDPAVTGMPTLYGEPVSIQCDLMVWNEDNFVDKCGETFKLFRRWYVMDWCRNIQRSSLQMITLLDTLPPVIDCPSDQTISNDPSECYATYDIPLVEVTDDCTSPGDFQFDYYVNGVFTNQTQNIQLPLGDNSIRIVVRDACLNPAECIYNVTVVDTETPVVVCFDDKLSLPSSGDITVGPEIFASIQYMDNCGVVDTMIRRVNTDCGNSDDQVFGDEVTFCCEDVGDTVMVEVKGIDAAGNMNTCMFMLEIQDKLPPTVICPPDTTVTCDSLSNDLSDYGNPFISDNCLFTVDSTVISNTDLCMEGSIERTWIATDEFGNMASCTQIITVVNPYEFDESTIVWPADTTISACVMGGTHPDSINSTPQFEQTPCETVGVTFTDMTMDPDSACLLIMRTWTITDFCENEDTVYVQMVNVINNAPPVLSVPSDTLLYANGNCLGAAALDSAFTNECSSGVIFENSYSSQGALVDTVFPLGTTQIIFTATDECNNVSQDTILVTVQDTTSPTIICLPDTVFSTEMDICSAIVELPIPMTDDNCKVISVVNDYNNTADASDTYPLGLTTVTYTVTDTSLNTASCSFTILVVDSVPPELSCPPGPYALYLDSLCNVTIPDFRDSVSVTDNCSSTSNITLTQTPMDMTMLMGVQDTFIQIIAEDESGNMDTCEIPINLIDTLAPSIVCPDNDTLYLDGNCEAIIENYRDSAMVMSNCTQMMNILITQSPDSGTIVSGANNVINITLTAEDSSMNAMSCTFTVTLLDTTPPEIVILDDTIVSNDAGQCGAFITFEVPLVSDNCIIDSFYNDYNLDSNASDFYPVGDTIVRYIVVDESGNRTVDSFMVTVIDDEGPVVSCPPDITIECTVEASLATTGIATATDNCDSVMSITFSDDTLAGSCIGEYTISRTFEAEDAFGNIDSCTQTISVIDTVGPQAYKLNGDDADTIIVSCDSNSYPSFLDFYEFFNDNACSDTIIVMQLDTIDTLNCARNYLVERTVYSVDECGNGDTVVQIIEDRDFTGPTFDNPPSDTMISCDDTLLPPTSLAVSDNCGTATYTGATDYDTITPWVFSTTSGDGSGMSNGTLTLVSSDNYTFVNQVTALTSVAKAMTFSFDWSYSTNDGPFYDRFGYSINGTKTLLSDTVGAIMQSGMDTVVLSSGDQFSFYIESTDDCCGDAEVIINNIVIEITPLTCPVVDCYIRRFEAVDDCGNEGYAYQLVTQIDTTAPVFDNPAPADTTVSCDNVPDAVTLTATDNCGLETVSFSADTTSGVCAQEMTIRRVWTASDTCGNTDSVEQIVTVIDTSAPVFDISAPADTTVECDEVPVMATLTATDNCGAVTLITREDTTAGSCPQEYTLRRVWTAEDECGNADSVEQTVMVIDTTAPVFDINPSDTTVDCDAVVPSPSPAAADNCGSVSMTAASSITQGDCPNEFIIDRSWTATDECGNSITITQTVTIQDTTDPVITCPSDVTIDCTIRAETGNTGIATATDNCETDVAITFSDDTTSGVCAGEYVIARTFIADDSCGNIASCIQTITVIDTLAPVFDNLAPADTTIACDETVPAPATLTATDNCSDVTVSQSADTTAGACPQEFTIRRVWIAADLCGNSDSTEQFISIIDTVAPSFDNFPEPDTTIDCDQPIPTPASLTATDNCGTASVNFFESVTSGSCPQEETITRIWVANDGCGNTDTVMRLITVQDTFVPVFDSLPPSDTTVNCDEVPPAVTLTASDTCGIATVTFREDTTMVINEQEYTLRRVWTAEDLCGNIDSVDQIVTVQDTTPPSLTCPADITLTLGANCQLSLPDLTGGASATDNCSPTDSITYEQIPPEGSLITEEGDTTILIIATDISGNSDTCEFIVTLEDLVPPSITCPASDTVYLDAVCSFELTDYRDSATVSDNCTDTVDIAISQIPDSGTIFNLDGDTVIIVQLIATDLSGNMDTCEFNVVVRDTTPPSISCPNDVTLFADENCKAIIPDLTDSVVLSDNCDPDMSIVATQSPSPGDTLMGEQTINLTFTVTDNSGQTQTCQISLTVQDTTPPMLTCPPDTQLTADSLCNIVIPNFMDSILVSDNCTDSVDLIISQNPAPDSTINVQAGDTIIVVITAQDSSGNTDTCQVLIEVIDTSAPTLMCTGDTSLVYLDDNCAGAIPDLTAEIIASGDNCTPNPQLTISQVPAAGTVFIVSGSFDTTVVITVEDENGNSASCEIPVSFVDTIPPTIICPADTLVECGYPFDLDALSADFGSATASDNCSGTSITTTDIIQRNSCDLIQTITRIFVAIDEDGNADTCMQIISVDGSILDLDSTDFTFQDTVSTFDCNFVEPSDIPNSIPMLDTGLMACNIIGIEYADSTNPNPGIGCIEIFRTFTVTDSCNFDPATGEGQFEFEQYVIIQDTSFPVFTVPTPDTMVYLDSCGTKDVLLDSVTASDCAGIDTIYNNSPFAFSNSDGDVSGSYPFGIHDVYVFAEDSCGNLDSTLIMITVTDSFPDTLTCNFKIIQDLDSSTLSATFISHEFFGSYTDSCGNAPLGEITTSYDQNDITDTIIVITCDSIDSAGGNFVLQAILYIWLDGILIDSCDIELGIDNPEICNQNTLTGRITTISGLDFNGAMVKVYNDFMSKGVRTDEQGYYNVNGLRSNQRYWIDPDFGGDPWEGISTFDLLLIYRHILDMGAIENPYYNIAADVDKSGSISGSDLIHLKKLILRMENELPVDNWRFVRTNYEFTDPGNACGSGYTERSNIMAKNTIENLNFNGLKVGDVDGSVSGNVRGRSASTMLKVQKDESGAVSFISQRSDIIRGFQMAVSIDQYQDIQLVNGAIKLKHEDFSMMENGLILISWVAPHGVAIEEGEALFSIGGINSGNLSDVLKLNSEHMNPEIYWNDEVPSDLGLKFDPQDSEFALYQNTPNPWMDKTTISFNLKNRGELRLIVVNAEGKEVYQAPVAGQAGYNEISIKATDLEGAGLYFYQLKGKDFNASKKMILVQ